MYYIDPHRCTGCGNCMNACSVGAIYMVDNKAQIDEDLCTNCGACLAVCANNAIHVQQVPVAQPIARQPDLKTSFVSALKPAATAVGGTLLSLAVSKLRDFLSSQAQSFLNPTSQSKVSRPAGMGRGHRKRFGARRYRGW